MKQLTNLEKAANAIAWIEVLINHSDGVPQGKNKLGDMKNGFCCLGLGCFSLEIPYSENDASSYELKTSVGLAHGIGEAVFGSKLDALYELNDSFNKTFPEIGTIMRDNAAAYFEPRVAAIISQMYADGVV